MIMLKMEKGGFAFSADEIIQTAKEGVLYERA
jgi:hypothetical protein